ncbi:protein RD3-like [Brienomyrus brachyistius]|uniref:protein RD3-like n=1 Tax=Brienomyrus brachyistius TaxID=42636 RepID=UPI0020B31CF8|nr:protein RD3-like [Brienomyrus brachyistius]
MPLFSWRKRPPVEEVRGGPLLHQLLWHVEEREQRRRPARGIQPATPQPLVAPQDRQQLELLCAQVPPAHAAAVLSRVKEVLASTSLLPWELVYVFQQVLRDFLCREEVEEAGPALAWASRCPGKLGSGSATAPECPNPQREEIPTISSQVERSMRWARPYEAQRDWDLPYYCPAPQCCSQAYSTAL